MKGLRKVAVLVVRGCCRWRVWHGGVAAAAVAFGNHGQPRRPPPPASPSPAPPTYPVLPRSGSTQPQPHHDAATLQGARSKQARVFKSPNADAHGFAPLLEGRVVVMSSRGESPSSPRDDGGIGVCVRFPTVNDDVENDHPARAHEALCLLVAHGPRCPMRPGFVAPARTPRRVDRSSRRREPRRRRPCVPPAWGRACTCVNARARVCACVCARAEKQELAHMQQCTHAVDAYSTAVCVFTAALFAAAVAADCRAGLGVTPTVRHQIGLTFARQSGHVRFEASRDSSQPVMHPLQNVWEHGVVLRTCGVGKHQGGCLNKPPCTRAP